MSEDPRDEALSIIHDLAGSLLVRNDLTPEVARDIDLILALTRYQANILSTQDKERLRQIRQRGQE